jgi:hypothetical protein
MGLDIWFKDDISRILRAVDEANLSALAAGSHDDPHAPLGGTSTLREAYREGFAAALATVAVALGLPLPTISRSTGPHCASHTREVTPARITRLVDSLRR